MVFLKDQLVLTVRMVTCFCLTSLCQYSFKRDPWDVDLKSSYVLNASILNLFHEVKMKPALEVVDSYQECHQGKLLFVASLICLQNQNVTLFCDLVIHVTGNRKMCFSCIQIFAWASQQIVLFSSQCLAMISLISKE